MVRGQSTPDKQMTLQEAMDELRKAQMTYHRLVKQSPGGTDEERAKHTDACRKALRAKRHAAAVVEAIKTKRPIPKAQDAIETR